MNNNQENGADFTEFDVPSEVGELLETLTLPGAASLVLDQPGAEAQPVIVASISPGESITLDVSAIREVLPALRRGTGLRLVGQGVDGLVRTPVLSLLGCEERDGRMQCRCEYPRSLQQFQRRDSYRAVLRLGMAAGVLLRDRERPPTFQGDLRDLSMEGCRVELPPSAAETVSSDAAPLELEFCFPSGERFVVMATPRRRIPDQERGLLSVGFAFVSRSPDVDRQLWQYVREIEREAARRASRGTTLLQVSALFQLSATTPIVGLRHAQSYATPMARRLAPVAGYLDNQILELRDGGMVDSVSLSRAIDLLLGLLEEDREALLFALSCLPLESQLVQHAVAVAARLADIGRASGMPRELLKALAACAALHDLGKTLLPPEIVQASARDAEQELAYRSHVHLLLPRLATCQWLAAAVLEAVVEGIHERLDGSGYPHRWHGERLHELTRLAAVVAEVDSLGRPAPDRPALAIDGIYRQLGSSPGQFDARWVERYRDHFGALPVGTLLRYPGGVLGWVRELDAGGRPGLVQLTDELAPPGDTPGETLRGAALERLGVPEPVPFPAREGAALY